MRGELGAGGTKDEFHVILPARKTNPAASWDPETVCTCVSRAWSVRGAHIGEAAQG